MSVGGGVLTEKSAAAGRSARLEIGRFKLRAMHVPGLPVVSCRAFIRGGSRLEPKPGWSYVVGRLLGEGTQRRDFQALAEDAEGRGAWQQTTGTGESMSVVVDALATDWQWALDQLLEMLLEPTFPQDRLDWLRRQVQAELESMLDQPDARTGLAFIDQLFSPHPYGRPIQGDRESLAHLSRELVFDLHRRSLGRGGCLSVAGDIDPERVVEHLAARLRTLDSPFAEAPQPPKMVGDERRREIEVPGEQAHLFMGSVTVGRKHPDLAAMEVLGVVLGSGGLSGRLPLLLREKEGLAYHLDVSAAAGAGLDPGRFSVYMGTSKRHVPRAEALIRKELSRLLDLGIEDRELEEARGYLLGRAPFRLETTRQRAELMAEAALYDTRADDPQWWPECLREVTRADVERVAREWLRPESMRVTVGIPSGR